jgi:hypothetical protein
LIGKEYFNHGVEYVCEESRIWRLKGYKAKSIQEGGGSFNKPDHRGDQDAAKVSMPKQRPGFQERDVASGSGAKGNGSSVNCWATTKDPNQKGGSRYAK